MKAVIVRKFGSPEDVRVEDIIDPAPKSDEVLIDVEAAEMNYPDILVIEGRYQAKPPLPFVPGKVAVGRVAMLGGRVMNLSLDARVAAQVEHGAYAEKVCAPAQNCFPVPTGLSSTKAAALGLTYQTAWFALADRAGFVPGETVLVMGAGGGVGIAAIQLAKALGARLVIGASRGSAKTKAVREAGADHVLDLSRPNLREELRAEVRALTGEDGVDIVIDPIGGPATEAAMRALAWRGRLVVVGFAAGDIPIIKSNYLLVKNIAVSGLQWSDYRDRRPADVAQAQAAIFKLATEGKINPHIDTVIRLDDFADGLARLKEGRVTGKIIMKIER